MNRWDLLILVFAFVGIHTVLTVFTEEVGGWVRRLLEQRRMWIDRHDAEVRAAVARRDLERSVIR